jgi:single-strand DNA-binding protein
MDLNEAPEALSNLAVIRGAVPHDAQERDLPSGGVVAQFDVTTRVESGGSFANVSVPIAWNDPSPAQLALLVEGAEVVVVGTVRRRFFRVGGATQSRTEVVADAVIPARRHKRVDAAIRAASERLLELAG